MPVDFVNLKKVVRSICAENIKGMTLQDLEKCYRQREGTNLPLLGIDTIVGLFQSWTDIVSMEYHQGTWLIIPVGSENSKHNMNWNRTLEKPQRRVQFAQVNYESESNRNKFCNANAADSKEFEPLKPINPSLKRNDNANRNTMQPHRSQSNHCMRSTNEDTNKENANETGENDGSDNELVLDTRTLHFEDEETRKMAFKSLPQINVQAFKIDGIFRAFISEIHSPHKFWFQPAKCEDSINLLMDSLNHFYYRDGSVIAKNAIPEGFLSSGMICAALYDSAWHRAKIIKVLDNSVQVFYVDYGTVDKVLKKDVRFLVKQFAEYPTFAVRGTLDKVKPNDGTWTLEAHKAFAERLKYFYSQPILAEVTHINSPERTVYLNLIDTRGVINIRIKQWLIERNYAVTTQKKLFDFQQRHFAEVWPSFEYLESGKYPSLKLIKQMKADGFDFLKVEMSNIIDEMFGYETIE